MNSELGASSSSAAGEDKRWNALLTWLRERHGMDVGNNVLLVERRAAPGSGHGLFALKSCPRSDTLFTIPADVLINTITLSKIYRRRPNGRTLSAYQQVSLHLLLHKPYGNAESLDPAFGPYISILPREFDSHPLTWTVRSRQKLEGNTLEVRLLASLPPSVTAELGKLQTRFDSDWKAVHGYLQAMPVVLTNSTRSDLNLPRLERADPVLEMDFLWAWLNVNTRSIYYRIAESVADPDNLTLCPILDFANHAPTSTHIMPVIPSEIWQTSMHTPQKRGGDYMFLTNDAIVRGQELFLRYGGHPNRTLFVEYGFVNPTPTDEAGDYGEVDVQDVVESLFGDRRLQMQQILEEEGYWGEWTLHSAPKPAHPSYRLITALRLFRAMDGSEFLALEETLQAWRDVLQGVAEVISEANEREWKDTLIHICNVVAQRAHGGLRDPAMRSLGMNLEVPGWYGWMRENIERLWSEEQQVAIAVMQSAQAGAEF